MFSVDLVKFGMKLNSNVYAQEGRPSIIVHAWLFNNVETDRFGIQIPGNVNVNLLLYIMVFTVFPILARMEEFGMMILK